MSEVKIKKKSLSFLEKIKTRKNEFLKHNLSRLIKYSTAYLRKIGAPNYENSYELEDFGPVILTGKDDKHSKLVKYAIDNPNILNLALTGALGSGKSSILKTFELNFPEYECLNISLATFDKKTLLTEKIEYNILKQLFYSVEHKKIPESRFKRIENHTGIWSKTILFSLWLLSISYFLKFEFLENLKKNLHVDYFIKGFDFLYGLYLVVGTIVILNKVMNFIVNFKLMKFKIKETDFENDQDKKTINFENEIDEILYFFERNSIDIVFFQDLDRFNDSEIFIKLREINTLINNYEPIKKQRIVTFIYAVSDDVFKEKERAKFFDFIIPVIPIINYTSSSSKFLLKFDLDIKSGKLSKGFIEDATRFLNDYRTIKSIYNEYTIYKKIIGKQLDNYNNLLAMIIYKNIEPTDFEKLNSNEGYVYDIIQNSDKLIAKRIQILKDKNLDLSSKLDDIKNEKLKNIKELRMVYILKFCELINSQNNYSVFGFYLNSKRISLVKIITDEYFDLFRNQLNINYYYNNQSQTYSGFSFSQIEKELDNSTYIERLETLNNKVNINQIKIELNEIENRKQDLNSKKLFELLDENNSTTYFEKYNTENNTINNKKLINYLLSNGNINEDYNHYISYFHPGSITKEDNDFLISLLFSENALSYNHKLSEIKSLIKQIKPENYNRVAILNFSFIDYLIENRINNKLNSINNLIKKGNKKSIKFIDEYLEYTNEDNKSVFFKILLNNWNDFWNLIMSESDFPEEKIKTYLKYIFKYLDIEIITKIDKKEKLSKYISTLENLNCFNENELNLETFKKFIENSNVKFENLEYNEDHNKLFEFIYDNNKYAINEQMIELFITNFNQNGIDTKKLKTANYTTIKNSEKPKLIKYVDDSLEEYLENIFLKLQNNINESEENICLILNNEDITIRLEIIEKGKFSIADLSKINDVEVQSTLIIEQKIETNWANLITYYKKSNEINETLSGYLNLAHIYIILSKILIDDSDPTIKTNFSKDLIKSNISDKSFSKLTYSLPFGYKDGNEFVGISDSMMESLINSKRILLSADNYHMIDKEFNDLVIILLEKNVDDFMKTIKEYALDSSIILKIIKSTVFSHSQKSLIIETTSDSILIDSKNLLIILSEFLLPNKINTISSTLLIELISNSDSLKQKVELTNQYFNFIEDSRLTTVIEKIGEPYSRLLLGKRPKVKNTNYNQLLIKNLEGKLISKPKNTKDNKEIELFPYTNSRM